MKGDERRIDVRVDGWDKAEQREPEGVGKQEQILNFSFRFSLLALHSAPLVYLLYAFFSFLPLPVHRVIIRVVDRFYDNAVPEDILTN